MPALLAAVQQSTRRLLKSPGFSLAVVVTLGLGSGAVALVSALTNAVLVRPLPYPSADRLVALEHSVPGFDVARGGLSGGLYDHYRAHSRVLDEIGVYQQNDHVVITDGERPERIRAALVTPSVFSVLRVPPRAGRLFGADDGRAGAPAAVVISHDLWVRRYGGDAGLVHRTIELNRLPFEVIGVLPPDFGFPHPETQVWYALSPRGDKADLRSLYLDGVARLREGVSKQEAETELRRLISILPDAYADASPELLRDARIEPLLRPLKDVILGDVKPTLILLQVAAGFVLVITLANSISLFLIRADRQRRDVAVHFALGGSPGDLLWRSLGESMVLAGLGGVLGLALAHAGIASGLGLSPDQFPRLKEVRTDAVVVALTLGVAAVSGLLLGLAAFARTGHRDLTDVLKSYPSPAQFGRKGYRTQRIVVALQISLALSLLVGCVMLISGVWRLQRAELGFSPKGLVTFEIALPALEYLRYPEVLGFYETLLEQLRQAPGITAAEASSGVPLTPTVLHENVRSETAADPPGAGEVSAAVSLVTPGYFALMRIPILEGRGFLAGDLAPDAPAVILSDALARALFRGEAAVGRRVQLIEYPEYPAYSVVGLVGDVAGEAIPDTPSPTLYFPVMPAPFGSEGAPLPYIPGEMTIIARSDLTPASFGPMARRIVGNLDSKLPVTRLRGMEQLVEGSYARMRLTTLLLLIAAGTALFLAVVGIYGVVSYSVSERTFELGVRMALGATPGAVSRLILRQATAIALLGIGAGVVAAFALTRSLRALLYQVSPGDPVVFGGVSAVLLAIVLAASYVPARRAGKTDALDALKAR